MATTTQEVSPRKAEAARRVQSAEILIYGTLETLANAQTQLSVIGTGLNQEWSKIEDVRTRLKSIWYALEKHRESGRCDLDDTSAFRLDQQKSARKPKKRAR